MFRIVLLTFIGLLTLTGIRASEIPVGEIALQKQAQAYADDVDLYARNDPGKALAIADQSKPFFEQHHFPDQQLTVINESAYALYFQARYPESLQRAKEAEQLAESHQLQDHYARAKVLQGNVMQIVGEFQEALSLYQSAASYFRRTGNEIRLGRTLNNIANVHYMSEQYEMAMEYYRQYGQLSETDYDQASVNLGIANSLSSLGQLTEAEAYYRQAVDLFVRANDQVGVQLSLASLGHLHLRNQQSDRALSFFNQAHELLLQGNRQYNVGSILKGKAKAYLQQKRYTAALNEANEALKEATRQQDDVSVGDARRLLAEIYQTLNRHDEALRELRLAEQIEKRYLDEKAKIQIAVLHASFENERKQHEIELLRSEARIRALEVKEQNALWVASFVGLLLLMAIVLFLFYRRTQQKLLREHALVSEKLRELDKTKDQVLVNTSHELRTPLNGIIGMSQLLLSGASGPLNTEMQEQIGVIESCGQRLLHLVQDILDYSQLQMGRLRMHLRAVDTTAVLQHASNLLHRLADEKGLELRTEIEPALPMVLADEARLHQILLNLIGNAIKFSRRGTITISAKLEGDKVRIQVRDQGPGIPADKQQHIFRPFEQVDGSSIRRNDGSGLGLPITKELLRLHNSDIQLDSVENQGTTFSFALPLATVPESPKPSMARAH